MTQAVTESAARTEAVMVRQDERVPIHFDTGDGGPVCKQAGGVLTTTDPREVTCGQCERRPVWKKAWHEEAKRAKVPAP